MTTSSTTLARAAAALALALALAVPHARALAQAQELELNKIRLVQPPAQVLLGASAAVQHPGVVQDLGLSLLASASGATGVPTGLSLESTPVLAARGTRIEGRDYYANSLRNILWRRLTFSIATQRGDSVPGAVAPSANAAFGVRTLLYDSYDVSRRNRDTTDRITEATQRARGALARIAFVLEPTRDTVARAQRQLAALDSFYVRQTAALVAADASAAAPLRRALQDSLTVGATLRRDLGERLVPRAAQLARDSAAGQRTLDSLVRLRRQVNQAAVATAALVGLRVEAAAGLRGRFPDGRWESASWDGVGLWLTPSYRSERGWQATAVGRYLTRVREYDEAAVLDLGGRVDYTLRRLTLGAEAVRRWIGDAERAGEVTTVRLRGADRWAAIAEYRLDTGAALVSSFGSDFRRRAAAGGTGAPVVSTVGLTFGFGSLRLVEAAEGGADAR